MDVEIRHALPGRLRLGVPALRCFPDELAGLAGWLAAQPNVSGVRANPDCASLTVDYPAARGDLPPSLLNALACVDPWGLSAPELAAPSPPRLTSPELIAASGALVLSASLGPVAAPLVCALTLFSALPSYRRARDVLVREGRFNVDFLDAVAITLALGRAQLGTASFITWLVSLGDWIRDLTAAKSQRTIEQLLDYQSQRSWVLREGRKVEIAVRDIALDDTVVVYGGGLIAVDGIVIDKEATVDQQTITGESLPVLKRPGDVVFAGTVVQDGELYLRATRVGNQTTVARIVRLVRDAPVGETRAQNYAETLADGLVAPSLALSGGLFALSGNVDRLLSMTIIDYGTGIRVAAPTTILAAMTDAARRGILIKGGSQIEKLAQADTFVFDKTGTVTIGAPRILDVVAYDRRHFPADEVVALAAGAEARLKHPVALALATLARERGIEIPRRQSHQFRVGLGVEAEINGYHVHVGNERFCTDAGIKLAPSATDLRRLDAEGISRLLVAVDGRVVGLLPFADQIRPEMPTVIARLHERGFKQLIMLTGDSQAVAEGVARKLGFDRVHAGTLPAAKADIVAALKAEGHLVAMVGDGINDSAALAFADIGIAMKNGADITRQAADVVLLHEGLEQLVTAVDISREAMRLIHQSFTLIAGVNTGALLLAIPAGLASPSFIALLSNGSAVLASLNAVRPILRY